MYVRVLMYKSILKSSDNQNFWQLAVIQSAALGLPIIELGGELAQKIGPGIALGCVLLGNLILWLIGVSIISMTEGKNNGIENIGEYVGSFGKYTAALILIIGFLGWYSLQTHSIAIVFHHYVGGGLNQTIRYGAIFGIITAMISMGGIKTIRWLTTIAFPIFIFFFFYILLKRNTTSINFWSIGISASGLITIVLSLLPGMINLPTFFRHSKSKAHSYLAITLITIFTSLFQTTTILGNIQSSLDLLNSNLFPISVACIAILTLICINVVNIYFASAAFESIAKRPSEGKDFAIFGLIGTGVYSVLQSLPSMTFLYSVISCSLSALGVTLLIAFIIRLIVSHRPRTYEKSLNNLCWFAGCLISLLVLINNPENLTKAVLSSVGYSAFSYLLVIFIEETIWSYKNSSLRKKSIKNSAEV